jgi:MATE family multidrug resistance protein
MQRLIPGLFPLYRFKVLSKYLQTQNILAPSVIIGMVAVVNQVLFCSALIFKAGWGIAGAPW